MASTQDNRNSEIDTGVIDRAWSRMQEQLDAELPQRKRRPLAAWWWTAFALVGALLTAFVLWSSNVDHEHSSAIEPNRTASPVVVDESADLRSNEVASRSDRDETLRNAATSLYPDGDEIHRNAADSESLIANKLTTETSPTDNATPLRPTPTTPDGPETHLNAVNPELPSTDILTTEAPNDNANNPETPLHPDGFYTRPIPIIISDLEPSIANKIISETSLNNNAATSESQLRPDGFYTPLNHLTPKPLNPLTHTPSNPLTLQPNPPLTQSPWNYYLEAQVGAANGTTIQGEYALGFGVKRDLGRRFELDAGLQYIVGRGTLEIPDTSSAFSSSVEALDDTTGITAALSELSRISEERTLETSKVSLYLGGRYRVLPELSIGAGLQVAYFGKANVVLSNVNLNLTDPYNLANASPRVDVYADNLSAYEFDTNSNQLSGPIDFQARRWQASANVSAHYRFARRWDGFVQYRTHLTSWPTRDRSFVGRSSVQLGLRFYLRR